MDGNASGKWIQPVEGWIKANVDASTNASIGGIGIMFQEYRDHFIGVFALPMVGQKCPEVLEVSGIKEFLTWLKERNQSKVIMESDYAVAVNAIKSGGVTRSNVSMIIFSCISFLTTMSDVRVELVRRSANIVAH